MKTNRNKLYTTCMTLCDPYKQLSKTYNFRDQYDALGGLGDVRELPCYQEALGGLGDVRGRWRGGMFQGTFGEVLAGLLRHFWKKAPYMRTVISIPKTCNDRSKTS